MDNADVYVSRWKLRAIKFVLLILAVSVGANVFLFLHSAHVEGLKREWKDTAHEAVAELYITSADLAAERARNDKIAEGIEIQSRCLLTTLAKLNNQAGIPFTPDEMEYVRTNEPNPTPFPETERDGGIPDGPELGYGK
jgi:hypothetical protein